MQEQPRRMVEGRTASQCIRTRDWSRWVKPARREVRPVPWKGSCGSECRWRWLVKGSGLARWRDGPATVTHVSDTASDEAQSWNCG